MPATGPRWPTCSGIDADAHPDRPSLAYDQIIEGILRGTIKGLWVVATNSAHSWINQTEVRELLDRLDFLVVQDMYATTETAQQADLVLPAAGWGEKDGTFINSERRIGRIRRVTRAPGEALADFSIFKLVAEAWGCGDLFRDWETPEAVFAHPGPRCRPGGPATSRASTATPTSTTAASSGRSRRARPIRSRSRRTATGRNGGSSPTAASSRRTAGPGSSSTTRAPVTGATVGALPARRCSPDAARRPSGTPARARRSRPCCASSRPQSAYVEIGPADADAIGIEASEWVVVESARGSMRARALVTPTVPDGHVFVPMHDAATNRLTFPAFDPHSRQPSYKTGAVAVRPLHSWER